MAKQQLDRVRIVTEIRRRTTDRELRRVLLLAIESPELQRARFTTNGLMVFTANGSAQAHWSPSDPRATKNLLATLRRIGLLPR